MPLQRPLATLPMLQNYANTKVTHNTSYIFADSNTIATPQMLQNYTNSKMARHTNVTFFLITIPLTTRQCYIIMPIPRALETPPTPQCYKTNRHIPR